MRRTAKHKSGSTTNLAGEARESVSPTSSSRRWLFWSGVLIVALGAVSYLPYPGNDFIWDDDYYVTQNAPIKSLGGLKDIWLNPKSTPQYYPLVYTTFWIEYRFWELNPTGYRVVNVILQLAAAVALWRVLVRLGVPGALLAAVVFAVHPVNVESVAWVTERKNVLSGLIYLLTAAAFFRFSPPEPETPARRRWGYYALAFGLFIAALLSKTATCTLPAALMLVLWWKRRKPDWRDALSLLPMLLLGLGMGWVTGHLERTLVGAWGADWTLSPAERFIVAGRALWFYFTKLVMPHPLVFIYPRWNIDGSVWWQYLYPATAAAVIVAMFLLRRRIGKGPLTAVLFYAGTLLPVLGFVDFYMMRYSYVADHFQYLAGMGMIAFLAAIIWLLRARLPAKMKTPATCAVCAMVAALMATTMLRAPAFRNAQAVWEDVLKWNDCMIAHGNLGDEFRNQGKLDQAREQYLAVLRISPTQPSVSGNLGAVLVDMGDANAAVDYLLRAINLNAVNDKFRFNLGRAYQQLGQFQEAADAYSEAIRLRPDEASYYFVRANVLARLRRIDEAIADLEHCLRLDPNNPDTLPPLNALKKARAASQTAPTSTSDRR